MNCVKWSQSFNIESDINMVGLLLYTGTKNIFCDQYLKQMSYTTLPIPSFFLLQPFFYWYASIQNLMPTVGSSAAFAVEIRTP